MNIMTTKATNKSGMSDAARKARAAYQREWNKKNPDKVKRYRDNYWERMAAKANDTPEKGMHE